MPGGPFGNGSSPRDRHSLQTWRISLVRIIGGSRKAERIEEVPESDEISANDWPLKVRVSLKTATVLADDRARSRQGDG